MRAAEELYPPVQYGPGWLLLAVGVIVVLVAAGGALILLTRPVRAAPVPLAPPPQQDAAPLTLRQEYLSRIDRIERDYRARRIDPRRANLELSRTVRAFVNEHSGLEAPVLALDDLIARGVHPPLIDALDRHYYPSIFRTGAPVDPVAGAEAARRVVTTWH